MKLEWWFYYKNWKKNLGVKLPNPIGLRVKPLWAPQPDPIHEMFKMHQLLNTQHV